MADYQTAFQDDAFQTNAFQILEEVMEEPGASPVIRPYKVIVVSEAHIVVLEQEDIVRIIVDEKYTRSNLYISESPDIFTAEVEVIEIIEKESREAEFEIKENADKFGAIAYLIKEEKIVQIVPERRSIFEIREKQDHAIIHTHIVPLEIIKEIANIKKLNLRKEEEEFLIMLLVA